MEKCEHFTEGVSPRQVPANLIKIVGLDHGVKKNNGSRRRKPRRGFSFYPQLYCLDIFFVKDDCIERESARDWDTSPHKTPVVLASPVKWWQKSAIVPLLRSGGRFGGRMCPGGLLSWPRSVLSLTASPSARGAEGRSPVTSDLPREMS